MYMAGIQEIDEYPRVLSDAGMIPRNHQVVETTADYNWLDRIINWGARQDWYGAKASAHYLLPGT